MVSLGFACQKEAIEEDIIPIPSALDSTHFEGVFYGEMSLVQKTLPPYDVHNTNG